MKQALLNFVNENNLSPFNSQKSLIKLPGGTIFKTRDAKSVHTKVLSKISSNFIFSETANLLNYFSFTNDFVKIKIRQEFFKLIKEINTIKEKSFLKNLNAPRAFWKPEYDVVVVTEDTNTFDELKKRNCPVQLLISETDVMMLEDRDIVQVIDCGEFSRALESLPQAVFLQSLDEAYVERYLEILSGWKENLEILLQENLNESLRALVTNLAPLLELTNDSKSAILNKEEVETAVEQINEAVSCRLKELTISGDALVQMLNKGILPPVLKEAVQNEIKKSNLPIEILQAGIPVKIDEEELEKLIQKQNINKYANSAEKIKSHADELKQIPNKIKQLEKELLYFDFSSGIARFTEGENINFPLNSSELKIIDSKNLFLDNAHPISFHLGGEHNCSILTGANSGGKTTLIEHILQVISLFQLGLPVHGNAGMPVFSDVYYFAKNKGSMSKGAFETLLTQMSKIKPGNKTLILADEIEAVTEPGVAGNIISATAEYYIKQNCFLVIATHLGHEIQKTLPEFSRIDGIEAKGLDENFELIVDHNPVLGRLAHSTPELIVAKMANINSCKYFRHLHEYLNKKNE